MLQCIEYQYNTKKRCNFERNKKANPNAIILIQMLLFIIQMLLIIIKMLLIIILIIINTKKHIQKKVIYKLKNM